MRRWSTIKYTSSRGRRCLCYRMKHCDHLPETFPIGTNADPGRRGCSQGSSSVGKRFPNFRRELLSWSWFLNARRRHGVCVSRAPHVRWEMRLGRRGWGLARSRARRGRRTRGVSVHLLSITADLGWGRRFRCPPAAAIVGRRRRIATGVRSNGRSEWASWVCIGNPRRVQADLLVKPASKNSVNKKDKHTLKGEANHFCLL